MIILKDMVKLKELLEVLNDILEPYISNNDFRSTNIGNKIRFKIHVFKIRYQKNLESAQPNKVDFKF